MLVVPLFFPERSVNPPPTVQSRALTGAVFLQQPITD